VKAFVTVGVERMPFVRLVKAVDHAVRDGLLSPDTMIQRGHTPYVPQYCLNERFFSFDEMVDRVLNADLIICHAGVGSVLLCRDLGRIPLVMPRLGRMGEHVDDHQQAFARVMEAEGHLLTVHDTDGLYLLLREQLPRLLEKTGRKHTEPSLCQQLKQIIDTLPK
jgi:UDP-N-acetylglucosamine transferase subunit ALG13